MLKRPLLLGHRGTRAAVSVPENTFASFDLALSHGCDGFEFDVRLTADGRAVICHDTKFASLEIAQANYEELVLQWDHVALPKPLSYERAGLPQEAIGLRCLEDVLDAYAGRAFLDIELKVPGLEDILLSLGTRSPQSGYVVSSFLPEVLLSLYAHAPSVPSGFICDRQAQLHQWRKLPITHVIPHYRLVTGKLIEEIHAAGKKLFVWTVNERELMLRLAAWGADGVLSDDTELLVQVLGQKGIADSGD